jgi:hypothetical protein
MLHPTYPEAVIFPVVRIPGSRRRPAEDRLRDPPTSSTSFTSERTIAAGILRGDMRLMPADADQPGTVMPSGAAGRMSALTDQKILEILCSTEEKAPYPTTLFPSGTDLPR